MPRVSAAILFLICLSGCHQYDIAADIEPVYRSAKDVEAAIDAGTNQITFGQLRIRMGSEILVLSDKAKQHPELREFANSYSSALDVYNLAALIWQCEGGIHEHGCEDPVWPNIFASLKSLGVDTSTGPSAEEMLRDALKVARQRQERIEDVYLRMKH